VVAKVWERLLVIKQESQQFDTGRFNLKRLNDVEVIEHYQVKISASTRMTVGTSLQLGEVLDSISKSQLKIILVRMKGSSINQSVMKNLYIKGSRILQWLQDASQINAVI
jgi:hypothetical protein